MLLDEPTSALDVTTERKVMQQIQKFRGKKTIILVTHRLATASHADHIVLMNHGKIVEQGNHQELIRKQGAYWQSWQDQMDESERDEVSA